MLMAGCGFYILLPGLLCPDSQKGGNQPQTNVTPRRFNPEEQGLQVSLKSRQGELCQQQCGTVCSQSKASTVHGKATLPSTMPQKAAGISVAGSSSCLLLPVVFGLSNQPFVCVSRPQLKGLQMNWRLHSRDTAGSSALDLGPVLQAQLVHDVATGV